MGAGVGAAGAIGFAILQIIAKRLRNAALVRRGEPPYKDVLFAPAPFVVLLGGLGAVSGAVAAAVAGGWWPAAVIAGGAGPALLAVIVVVAVAVQARR